MKKRLIGTLIGMLYCGIACAGDLEDMVQQAENAISAQYRTKRSSEIAFAKLDKILKDEKLDEQGKIKAIKKEFLDTENVEISEQNAHKLICAPPLTWNIHSIGIAYDVENVTTMLFSSQQMNIEDAVVSEQAAKGFKFGGNYSSVSSSSGQAGGKADFSIFNPLTWLSPKVSFAAETNASTRRDISEAESSLWSKKNQQTLTHRFEEMSKILSNTKISGCHLSFSITFQNNTDKDFLFSSGSTVPVYTGETHVMNASPVNDNQIAIQKIPAGGTATIIFRGAINNTKAQSLLRFMTNAAPQISPEQGQLFIYSQDGTIKNAIQTSLSVRTFSITCGNVEWHVRRSWNGKKITFTQALLAINSLYANPPFQFDKDGTLIKIFDFDCRKNADSKSAFTMPQLYECGTPYPIRTLPSSFLNTTMENDIEIKIINTFAVLSDKTSDERVRTRVQDRLEALVQEKNLAAKAILAQYEFQKGDTKKAFKMFQEIAKTDPKEADHYWINRAKAMCAEFYIYGYGAVEKDVPKATSILEPMVKEKNALAMADLAGILAQSEQKKDQQRAFDLANEAVTKGQGWIPPTVYTMLAGGYLDGEFVQQDIDKAIEFAKKGQPFLQSDQILAWCYIEKGNFKEAIRLLEQYCKKYEALPPQLQEQFRLYYADALAQMARYYDEHPEEPDAFQKMIAYAGMADENGNVNGAVLLGKYEIVLAKNFAAAFQHFSKAAKENHPEGLAWLGICYLSGYGTGKNPAEGIRQLERSLELGDLTGCCSLALEKISGRNTPKDLKNGYSLLREAANAGNATAQREYATLLLDGGEDFEKNPELGIQYLRLAMKKSDFARTIYARCLLQGIGVEKNTSEALAALQQLSDRDESFAQATMASLYADGKQIKRNPSKCFELAKKSAEQGIPLGQFVLGLCYRDGIGCSKDLKTALIWIKKAAEQGFAPAVQEAERLGK